MTLYAMIFFCVGFCQTESYANLQYYSTQGACDSAYLDLEYLTLSDSWAPGNGWWDGWHQLPKPWANPRVVRGECHKLSVQP